MALRARLLAIAFLKTAHNFAQWGIFCPVSCAGGEIDQDNLTLQSSGWCRQIDDNPQSWLSPFYTPSSGTVDRHRPPSFPDNVHGIGSG